ncbi:MAG: TatD family hydrolase [bacterium]
MDLIDTHCHLNFKSFKSDFFEVAKRSHDHGVKKIIIVGSDPNTSADALEISKKINKLISCFAFVSVGIHAIHTDRVEFEKIEKLAEDPEVVAIGESGLDFYHDKGHKTENEQIELFKKHIELALKIDKPLIIHNREADEKVREVVGEFPKLKQAVFHCFSTDHHMATWAIEHGFYLSFTGNITYGNKKIKKAIERTPIERIMVETDAPYNIPEPLRSQGIKRCEPYMTSEVIKKIALIKGLDANELSKQIYQNSVEFFVLPRYGF